MAFYLACDDPIRSAYVGAQHEPLLSRSTGDPCRFYWHSVEVERTFRNMTARAAGTQVPTEIVVVGAHIDSFPGTTGASDNACGSAMPVEFARWFVEHPPVRTVQLVWFTGEELDRRGSRAYVAAHGEESICLYMNVDSGCSIEHGTPQVAVDGGMGMARAVQATLPEMGQQVRVHGSTFESTDAFAFRERGISTAFVHAHLEAPRPHPHLPTDRWDTLDLEQIRGIGDLSLTIVDAAQRCNLEQTS